MTTETYCLACNKPGHLTTDCHSTHGLNTPAARELFRLVRAASVQAPEGGDDLRTAFESWAQRTPPDERTNWEVFQAGARAALAAQPQAVATLPAQEAPAAVPMCSEQAVLHALTMARSETHQQGDAALWQAFGRAMWRQFNAMAAAAQAPAEGDEGELRAMLQKLGFGPQCAESIGITLRRWKDGYSAALESQAKPKVTLTDEQIDELWSQHGGGAFLTYVEHNRRRFAQIEDVKLRQLIRAVATAQAPAPAPDRILNLGAHMLFSRRKALAERYGFEMTEQFNALVFSVIDWAEKTLAVPSPAVADESAEAEFEVWDGDELYASASGPRAQAWAEVLRYADQCYGNGIVRVFEVTRVERTVDESDVPVQESGQ